MSTPRPSSDGRAAEVRDPDRRRPARLLLLVALAAVASLLPDGLAGAHRNDESYLYLDVGDTTLAGRVELPYRDLREVLGLDLEGSPDEVLAELRARADDLRAYADQRTSVGVDGRRWALAFDGIEPLFPDDDVGEDGLGYAILPFDVELDVEEVPRVLEIRFTPFLDEIPDRANVALVSNDWKRGVIDEETNELLVLTQDDPTGTIDLGEEDRWGNLRASVDLGVDHIRTGPDHVFFVLVLLLPSVLVLSAGRWHPSDSFRRSLGRLLVVATMFTVSHSITFTLAGLDLVPLPPSKLVETIIAASIAIAALHNLRPVLGHREWAIAFVFGLFHGLGFASLVEGLDIDRTTQLVSLLGRNIGIELGQLVIIVVSFPALFLLRRTRAYLPLVRLGSIALAVLSAMWIVERIWEVDLNVDGAVAAALRWPRSLYVVAALTVVAAAYRQVEASRDRLLATYADGDDGDGVDAAGAVEAADDDERAREPAGA